MVVTKTVKTVKRTKTVKSVPIKTKSGTGTTVDITPPINLVKNGIPYSSGSNSSSGNSGSNSDSNSDSDADFQAVMTLSTTVSADMSNDSNTTENHILDSKPALKRGRKPKYLHTIVLSGINARDLYRKFRMGKTSSNDFNSNTGIMEYVDGSLSIPTGSGMFLDGEYDNNSTNRTVSRRTKNSSNDSLQLLSNHTGSDTTCLFDITGKKSGNMFLESKTALKSTSTTFVDYLTFGSLPYRTDCCCWHDRHPFSTSPIGCPIRYVEESADKYMQSSTVTMTSTPYYSNEESTSNTSKLKKSTPAITPKVKTNNYYLSIGVFCSFPCVLAHIETYKADPLYKDSKSLLHSLYYKLYGIELKVNPASNWQCLKSYGGNMSIEEYRRSFCVCNYIITPDIKRPYMVSVGKYIEEQPCGYL